MKITAIVPAAGSSSRFGADRNKLLEDIKGVPVIVRTLQAISGVSDVTEVIVCTSEGIIGEITHLIEKYNIPNTRVILGGRTRQESVYKGLKSCSDTDIVLVHDGARPLVKREIILNSIECAKQKGATIVAVQAKDTIKSVGADLSVESTLDRSRLWNVQTPQVFCYSELLEVHEKFADQEMTDDSALIEKNGGKVYITRGEYSNIKITTAEDIAIAEYYCK